MDWFKKLLHKRKPLILLPRDSRFIIDDHNLKSIIFAYCRINNRKNLSLVSRESAKICQSYQYIISLNKKCIQDMFAIYLVNNNTSLAEICFRNPRFDPGFQKNFYIRRASAQGQLAIVKLLLADPRVNPSDLNNRAIERACDYGHHEILRLLLTDKEKPISAEFCAEAFGKSRQRVNPACNNNYPLRTSSKKGHLEVVRILLADERVDATLGRNMALRYALYNDHFEVAKLIACHIFPRTPVSKNWKSNKTE